MKFYLILSIFFLGTCVSTSAQSKSNIQQVSTKSMDSLFSTLPIFQIIDVRSDKEYAEKHVKGALNQDVS